MCATAAGRDPSAMSPSRSASTPFAAATAPAPTATACAPSATKGRAVQRVRGGRVNGVVILEDVGWSHFVSFFSHKSENMNVCTAAKNTFRTSKHTHTHTHSHTPSNSS